MIQKTKSDISPFKMCDNIYFVGSSKVSVHIIKTETGLVMIDTGYPDMYEQILDSMTEPQLDPKDICAIFHSHGHFDHFGCTREFKELSGAKTYISRIDNDIVNGTYDLSLAQKHGLEKISPFDCDVLIEDGDCFTFGSTTIRCRLTPGHTAGVISFFISLKNEGTDIVAAMHGGVGMNSMKRDFLNKYNLPLNCREIFRDGLHLLSHEHVDLVLGNHPGQNDTVGKLKKVMAGESITDLTEWKKFLSATEQKLDALLASESELKK